MRRTHDLDAKDRQILALLENDARRSNSEIARLTGLSAPTVAERIARLRDIGVIRGFTVRIDESKVGLPIAAIVEFQPRSNNDEEAIAKVVSHPAVRQCYRVTGPRLLMLLVRLPDNAALTTLLQQFSQHGDTHTAVVLATDFDSRPLFVEALNDSA